MKQITVSGPGVGCFALLLVLGMCISWFLNVYKPVTLDFEPSYKAEIVRTVGVFVPLVSYVCAWVEFDEEKQETEKGK